MDRADVDRQRALAALREALAALAPCRHSRDFSAVTWHGQFFNFTASQAKIVALLWEAWLNGTPDLRQETLLDAAGSETKRLVHLFKDHPAWGTLIVPGGGKGLFRLAEPPAPEPAPNPPER